MPLSITDMKGRPVFRFGKGGGFGAPPAANVSTAHLKSLPDLQGPDLQGDIRSRNGGLTPGRDDKPLAQVMLAIRNGELDDNDVQKMIRRNPASAQLLAQAAARRGERVQATPTNVQQSDFGDRPTEQVEGVPEGKPFNVRTPGNPQAALESAVRRGDTAQIKLLQGAFGLGKDKKGGGRFKQAATARKEFLAQSKDFVKVRDAMARVERSARDPSAAGDLALIFNYMKILDPGSVVRESEFATAANSGGVDDRTRAIFNKVRNGQRLSAKQRADFLDRARRLHAGQLKSHKKLEVSYRGISRRFGLDPRNVVIDFKLAEAEVRAKEIARRKKTAKKGAKRRVVNFKDL